MINDPFRITDTPRLSIVLSVISAERMRIYSEIPGAFRSATAIVASGVWSRSENPVPPLVRISSTWRWSARRHSSFFRSAGSSGRISVSTTS